MDKIYLFINTLQHISDNAILNSAFYLGVRIIVSVVCVILGVMFIKLIKHFLKKALSKSKIDEGLRGFIISFVSISLYLLLGFIIASGLGVDAATIVALLGSCGVAIGLAVQGSLSNLAGGVLLLLLKPFKVGDYIIEDSNKNEGTVKEIGLFFTKLQTLDDRTVILPNGTLANTSITNVTQTPYRMIELTFCVSYDTDLDKAYEIIKQVIIEDEATLQDKGIECYMTDMLDSSIQIAGRFYVKNKNFRFARQRVMEGVFRQFCKNDIVIPFPQLVIHGEK